MNNKEMQAIMKVLQVNQSYDFKPKSRENFSSSTFTFKNAIASETRSASLDWFGGAPSKSDKYLKNLKNTSQIPSWAENAEVSNVLLGSEKHFAGFTQISWTSSLFAARFAEMLSSLGASMQLLASPHPEQLEVLLGTWQLSNGQPFIVVGEAWRNSKTGKDFVYWHFDGLIHTRHFHLDPNPATEFFVPYLFQSLAFLSESSNPDRRSLIPTREEVFGGDCPAPRLVLQHKKNHFHAAMTVNEGVQELWFIWAAEVIRYGYIFDEVKDLADIEVAMAVATSSITKAADILSDGFSNFRGNDDSNFQKVTFADVAVFQEGQLNHFERGSFVPGPLEINMDSQSLYVYAVCQEVNQQAMGQKSPELLRMVLNGYQEIMSKGSGMCLPHAMNSYVYLMQNYGGLILGLSEEERSNFHDYGAKILTYVTTIPVDLQDANAYSNLALLEIGRKRYKEALNAVNAGVAILKEDRLHYPDSAVGNSRPLENPGIKLELFSTKAELIYRSGESVKAKELAQIILEEANSINYSGPDIEKVKWILAQP
jgi:hypothetical protein